MAKDKKEELLRKLKQVQQDEEDLKKLVHSTSEKLHALKDHNKLWQVPNLRRSKSDDLPPQDTETQINKSETEADPEDNTKKSSFGNS